jgi:hypothetical protein
MADIPASNGGFGLEAASQRVHGGRNGSLNIPAFLKASPDSFSADLGNPAPFHQARLSPTGGQKDVPGVVLLLLNRRRPTTIPGLVMPVIVDAVDARPGRPIAHVSEEVGEIHPTVADLDPAATVAGILGIIGIEASPLHVHPNDISTSTGGARFRLAVFRASRSRGRTQQTAARARVPAYQVCRRHGCALAAGTLAYPGASFGFLVDVDRRQVSECSPRQIMNFRHAGEYAVFPRWRQ